MDFYFSAVGRVGTSLWFYVRGPFSGILGSVINDTDPNDAE